MRWFKTLGWLGLLLIGWQVACTPTASTAPPTRPSASPTPTAKPLPTRPPTATPTATFTPAPTPTPSPTREPTQRFHAAVEEGQLVLQFLYGGKPGDYPGLQAFLDIDQNFHTGYTTRSVGAEFLAEILVEDQSAALHRYTGANQAAEWSWEEVQPIDFHLAQDRVEATWRIPLAALGEEVKAVDVVFRAAAKDWSVAYESPKFTVELASGQVTGPPETPLQLQPGDFHAEAQAGGLRFAFAPTHPLERLNAVQLYLDVDGNNKNGYLTIQGLGAEYLAEINLTDQTAKLYRFTGPSGSTEWQWEEVTALSWNQQQNIVVWEIPLDPFNGVEQVGYVFREVDTNWEAVFETRPQVLTLK